MIIFIFSLSQSFLTYFGLKWSCNGIFQFFEFFAIFLEFSITGRVGKKRNDNFYFLAFSAFFNLLWLEKMPWWCFLIFWICLLLFCNFLLRVGQERNGVIIFIFSLSQSFLTYFGLKWSCNGILIFFLIFFLICFLIFLEFSFTGRVGTKRNDNFYFLSFSTFFILLWLEKMPWWCFLIFWICLLLFCNFLLRVGQERNRMIIFIFSFSQSFLTYFGLKWSCNGIFQFF